MLMASPISVPHRASCTTSWASSLVTVMRCLPVRGIERCPGSASRRVSLRTGQKLIGRSDSSATQPSASKSHGSPGCGSRAPLRRPGARGHLASIGCPSVHCNGCLRYGVRTDAERSLEHPVALALSFRSQAVGRRIIWVHLKSAMVLSVDALSTMASHTWV